MIARQLSSEGHSVGVYKPVASGCELRHGRLWSEDAEVLWEAAGRPRTMDDVCPQRFAAPLAPHLAARETGSAVDTELLRAGIQVWQRECDIVLVEGAGGLMSPISDEDYVADLAADFGYPLVVVAPNRIGVINQTLQTLIAASTFREGLHVAAIVLNTPAFSGIAADDPSTKSNADELRTHCVPPLVACVNLAQTSFVPRVDWSSLAR
jgi:dethiobiotin synthetase